MTGLTGRPTAGARFALTREEVTESAVVYRGFVHLPDRDVPATVSIGVPSAAVQVTLGEGGTPELEKTAAAMVRATTKTLVARGSELPTKIVRWRG